LLQRIVPVRRINAPTLIELSIDTLRNEIQSQKKLGAEQRYALAMVIGALKTARAEILTEPDAAQWQLLDHIYDDGEGSVEQLARDIRSKAVSDETHPDLRKRLETLLVAELEVRNPAVLKRRAAGAG
jgi:hypothetical protein